MVLSIVVIVCLLLQVAGALADEVPTKDGYHDTVLESTFEVKPPGRRHGPAGVTPQNAGACAFSTRIEHSSSPGYLKTTHYATCSSPTDIQVTFEAYAAWFDSDYDTLLKRNSKTYRYSGWGWTQTLDSYEWSATQPYAYQLAAYTWVYGTLRAETQHPVNTKGTLYPKI